MTLLVTPRIRFLHMPKTGGRWVTAAMLAAGVPVVSPDDVPGHANLDESRAYGDRFTIAFVRHPLDFWRSYWSFRMRDGWDPASAIDEAIATEDFDEFIDGVIERFPGEAGAVFETFVGPPDAEIDFVGRFEHLVDDLVLALTLAGEQFDEAVLRSFPSVNASDYRSLPAFYRRESAQRLAACERAAIERFYYWEPVPERVIREEQRTPAPPGGVGEHIARSERALRTARAELAVMRRDAAERDAHVSEVEAALAALHASRLLRVTRPLRLGWYRLRPRHARSADARGGEPSQPNS